MLTKVYFPRLILPLASVMAGLGDFAIASAVLIAVMLYYGITPGPAIVVLPAFAVLALVSALAVGVWLSVLNVRYRDVRYVIPFLTQLWFYSTPVAYPSSLVPAPWGALYAVNPMVSVVDGFRWALLGQAPPPLVMIAVSGAAAGRLLTGGLYYFSRSARRFADFI